MKKFQTVIDEMYRTHDELFRSFRKAHDAYLANPAANQDAFNTIGSKVMDVARQYERVLCGKTESGQYGKFSSKLSDRYWAEIRKTYPKIDFIGAIIR